LRNLPFFFIENHPGVHGFGPQDPQSVAGMPVISGKFIDRHIKTGLNLNFLLTPDFSTLQIVLLGYGASSKRIDSYEASPVILFSWLAFAAARAKSHIHKYRRGD
jgi:hypothetical protein